MAEIDAFQEKQQPVKKKSFKKRFEDFWYYYKWYVIGGTIAVLIVSAFIKDMLQNKDYALYSMGVNIYTNAADTTPFIDDYTEYAGIDTEEYFAAFDNNFRINSDGSGEMTASATQMIMVYTAARDLDNLAMDLPNYHRYAYNSTFLDLREVFTAEELAGLQDSLYYIDRVLLNQIAKAQENWDTDFTVEYPDPSHPETMEDPIPVGLNLADSEKFNEYYSMGEATGYIGIVSTTARLENAKAMLTYLFLK